MDPSYLRALQLAEGREPTASEIERVAGASSPEAARWAFTQWRLRHVAKAKFERSSEMLFVREALEQATHERLAAYHASRFPAGELVADLTVGLGADLIALAARGTAVGFELDPERAECARHNLAVHGLEAVVTEGDALARPWNFTYAFADPSRRDSGRRLTDPDDFAPDPRRLAERMASLRLGGMKLSPMVDDRYLTSLGGRLEFVSFGRECREALVWLGADAGRGVAAVHVASGSVLPAGSDFGVQDAPSEYLFEADPAACRAHGLGTLCEEHNLAGLGDSNGYLTGSEPVDSPWLRCWRVLEVCPADDKATRSALRALDAGVEAVKSRGVKVDVEALGRRYRSDSRRQVVLVVYAVGKSRRHVIAETVSSTGR